MFFRTKTGFYLRKKLKKLLGSRDALLKPLHKRQGNFQALFQLIVDFNQTCSEKKLSSSSEARKIERVIDVLSSRMDEGFRCNFPFYIMMSWRLQSFSSKAKEYFVDCVMKLRVLNVEAIDVVREVIRNNIWVSWHVAVNQSSTKTLTEAFEFVCQEKFKSSHLASKGLEGLQILFFAGAARGLLYAHEGKKSLPELYWEDCIKFVNAEEINWSSEATDSLHLLLQFAAAVLPSSFSVRLFESLVKKFQIFSFRVVRDLLRHFFSLKSLETETCQVLSAILRAHFFYNTDSLLHIQYNALGDERLLQEACDLLLFFYEDCFKREITPEVTSPSAVKMARNEMKKWCEGILLCLSTTTGKWPSYATSFLRMLPEQMHSIFHHEVSAFLKSKAAKFPVAVFASAIDFVDPEALGHFFDDYVCGQVDLKQDQWQELFTLVDGSKSRKWNLAKQSVLSFLQRVANSAYISRPADFFLVLLSLSNPEKCPEILTVCGESSHDILLKKFSDFLLKYFKGHTLDLRRKINNVLSGLEHPKSSPLCDCLLDVYLQVVIPTKADIVAGSSDGSVADFVSVLECEMGEIHQNRSPVLSVKSTILWTLLARIVERVPVSSLSLFRMPYVVQLLGRVHDKVVLPSATEMIDEKLTHLQVCYKTWYSNVRSWLVEEKSRFDKGEMTVEECSSYKKKHDRIRAFSKCFSSVGLIPTTDGVNKRMSSFADMARQLIKLLYYKDQSTSLVISFEKVFEKWNVKIHTSVSDVREKKMLSTNSCDLQKMKFGCLVTYAQACETLAAVENWLAPLRKLMPMLGCFTANASILFSSYMEREMQQIEKLSATKGLDFKDPQKEDAEISVAVPLDTFKKALKGAKKSLKLLLKNDASYRNVSILGHERFRDVSIKAELEKLVHYEKFAESYREYLDEVWQGMVDMSNLRHYFRLICAIENSCQQYSMVFVREDSEFQKLVSEKETLMNAEKITTGECSALKRKLDKILLNTPHEKLRLFLMVQESQEFFKLIQKGCYYSTEGRIRFKEQVQLITDQLQSQEYDETVLNHLLVAFECVAPFTNPRATFVYLLTTLNESDKYSYNNWIKEICTVNSNMNLVKLWFSKKRFILLEGYYEEWSDYVSVGRKGTCIRRRNLLSRVEIFR
ncbi:uncharacterized protein [Oscarella lobularis]|uniref:uncharacterized protein isoform X2 n=1 Tax=Oscarella lobularis TaxID=121494 RepID=UPI003313D031